MLEAHGRARAECDGANAEDRDELEGRVHADSNRRADGSVITEDAVVRIANTNEHGVPEALRDRLALQVIRKCRVWHGRCARRGGVATVRGRRPVAPGPRVDYSPACALVGDPLLVEPKIQTDPELDDPRDERQKREKDEGELGRRLAAFAPAVPPQSLGRVSSRVLSRSYRNIGVLP